MILMFIWLSRWPIQFQEGRGPSEASNYRQFLSWRTRTHQQWVDRDQQRMAVSGRLVQRWGRIDLHGCGQITQGRRHSSEWPPALRMVDELILQWVFPSPCLIVLHSNPLYGYHSYTERTVPLQIIITMASCNEYPWQHMIIQHYVLHVHLVTHCPLEL